MESVRNASGGIARQLAGLRRRECTERREFSQGQPFGSSSERHAACLVLRSMNGQRSTIGLLERLAEMKSRFRQVASKLSQHVSCPLSGGQWTATNDIPAVSPAVTRFSYSRRIRLHRYDYFPTAGLIAALLSFGVAEVDPAKRG